MVMAQRTHSRSRPAPIPYALDWQGRDGERRADQGIVALEEQTEGAGDDALEFQPFEKSAWTLQDH